MTDPADAPAAPDRATVTEATTRRTMLRAAGLVTLAGGMGATIAACSSDAATTSAPSAAPATSTAPSASATAASSSAASPSAASPTAASSSASAAKTSSAKTSAKAPSGPSVAKADVAVGDGAILPNADYVVTQPKKGTYKAFSKICTHQGCAVQAIVNHEIVCKCHNSHFSIEDGSVLSGPAQAPLPAAKTTVSGDRIVIST